MVQKIRTSLVISLTVINLISILAIFMLINLDKSEIRYKNDFYIENNRHGNRYNLTNLYNNNEFEEVYHYKNFFINYTTYYAAVLMLNIICVFFWIFLISSFCSGEQECECSGSCCDANCNCGNCSVANGDAGKLALVCLLFICLILLIYYSLKCCGKHIARYISLSVIAFANFCILIFSLLMLDHERKLIYQIILFSALSCFANLSSIILPNLQSCERLRFRARIPSANISINQNPIPQYSNNVIMNNNNMNNYNNFNNAPIQANYVVYPNSYVTNGGPVANYESKPNTEKNTSINSNDFGNQIIVDNSNDMGDAPLPDNENQVKK